MNVVTAGGGATAVPPPPPPRRRPAAVGVCRQMPHIDSAAAGNNYYEPFIRVIPIKPSVTKF